jgi:arabinogalactan endo-1,4-beta-galactosidase
MWFSSSSGIFSAELTAFEKVGNHPSWHLPVTFYSSSEDMQGIQVYGDIQPAGFVARDGHVWFPGLSYYEMWDGPVPDMKATIDEVYYRYPRVAIAIAETAYYYTPNVLSHTDPLTYPTTPAGQTQFLTDVMTQAGLNPNLDYVFYWGTCWDQPQYWYSPWPDSSGTAQDTANRGLFDANGELLPAISVLTSY